MSTRRYLPLLLSIVGALLLLAACNGGGDGGDGGSPTPRSTPRAPAEATATPEPAGFELEYTNCRFDEPLGQEATCGDLAVPENRSNPDGRTIRIHFAVFESRSRRPEPDPIVYLDGGPGGKTLETAFLSFNSYFDRFLRDRDVILFDQRGIGTSEPALECPELIELEYDLIDQDLTPEEYNELNFEATKECHDRLAAVGIDLSAYNSAENAADVEALRRALGYEEWNLYGVSYGTRLALTVMRDFPHGVRSAILDSTYPIEADLYEEGPDNTARAFGALFSACAANEDCAAAYPDLEAVFYQEVARLNDAPEVVTLIDPFGTGLFEDEALLDGDALLDILFQSLYVDEFIPELPRMIYEVKDGDYEYVSFLYSIFLAQEQFLTPGMYLSVQCHDEASFTSRYELEFAIARYPQLDDYLLATDLLLLDLCRAWNSGQAPRLENQPVISDIPTLALAGEFDPVTPPYWGEEVARRLENGHFFEFPGLGHGVSFSEGCPQRVLDDFLEDPKSEPESDCVERMGPVNWATG